MKFFLTFIFLITSVFISEAIASQNPCDVLLNEPLIIQELRQLKWNALNSKDRAEYLILNKAFETKLAETAEILKVIPSELLKKIEQVKTVYSSTSTLKIKADVKQHNPYEKIISDFKKSYSNYSEIESRAQVEIDNIKSNALITINHVQSNDVNLYRAMILAITKLSLEKGKAVPWLYKYFKTEDFFERILEQTEDLTLMRAMHELSEINDSIQIKLEDPIGVYLNSTKYEQIESDGPQFEIIRFLVEEYGADISQRNKYNENMLHFLGHIEERTEANSFAILNYVYEIAPELFSKQDTSELMTPLFWFTSKELEWAIPLGFNLDLQDSNGDTLLHRAVKRRNLEQVKLLLDANADTKIKNDEKLKALDIAILHIKSLRPPPNDMTERHLLHKIKELITKKQLGKP